MDGRARPSLRPARRGRRVLGRVGWGGETRGRRRGRSPGAVGRCGCGPRRPPSGGGRGPRGRPPRGPAPQGDDAAADVEREGPAACVPRGIPIRGTRGRRRMVGHRRPVLAGRGAGDSRGNGNRPNDCGDRGVAWPRRWPARLGLRPASEIDHRATFASFGLGSVQAVALAGELEAWLGRSLLPTLAYEYPTIETLSRHLAGEPAVAATRGATGTSRAMSRSPSSGSAAASRVRGGPRRSGSNTPTASTRRGTFPKADGPTARAAIPSRIDFRRGGFLDGVDRFDADFFGIAPREAAGMDPQHRLLLEVAWEALEDAGQAAGRLAGTDVGVFVGIATDDYSRLRRREESGGHLRGDRERGRASRRAGSRTPSLRLPRAERGDRHVLLVIAGGRAPGVREPPEGRVIDRPRRRG